MPRPRKTAPNRSDSRYEVKRTVGKDMFGKPIRKSFYSYISLADARRQADEYMVETRAAELTGGLAPMNADTTFKEWALRWLEIYKKGKVKDNSYRDTYEAPTKNYLIPHFGAALLKDIRPAHIQQFFDAQGEKYSLETLKKMRQCLWGIFTTAIENDLCTRNPVSSTLKLTSSKSTPEKRAYTQAEYDVVHAFASAHPLGLSVLIMLETGITRSELLGLTWADFDAEKRVLHIRQGLVEQKSTETDMTELVTDGLKNKHRRRDIPISAELARRIADAPRTVTVGSGEHVRHTITQHIIHAPAGGAYSPHNWSKRVYARVMNEMHEKHPSVPVLNPHELRHTRATLWKDDGVDLFSIARLLGHADLTMLAKRYAHDNVETLRKALGL